MTKQASIIRKHEARPARNPQRIALLVAIYSAVCAVAIGFTFLYGQTEVKSPEKVITVKVEAETVNIVTAKRNIAYNQILKRSDLKIVKWPKGSQPENAFRTIDAMFSAEGERYFMTRIAKNEVILPVKLSEPGRKVTLAALLRPDTRAVAVHVDAVLGVSGFVRPGDFVDVIMTRSTREDDNPEHYSIVLLQEIHVLGVDLTSRVTSDLSDTVKRAAKTVTLEVDLAGAQKLALANTVGRLSLALRRSHGTVIQDTARISLSDLGRNSILATQGELQLAASGPPPAKPAKRQTKLIGVTRAVDRTEMEVTQE